MIDIYNIFNNENLLKILGAHSNVIIIIWTVGAVKVETDIKIPCAFTLFWPKLSAYDLKGNRVDYYGSYFSI